MKVRPDDAVFLFNFSNDATDRLILLLECSFTLGISSILLFIFLIYSRIALSFSLRLFLVRNWVSHVRGPGHRHSFFLSQGTTDRKQEKLGPNLHTIDI